MHYVIHIASLNIHLVSEDQHGGEVVWGPSSDPSAARKAMLDFRNGRTPESPESKNGGSRSRVLEGSGAKKVMFD